MIEALIAILVVGFVALVIYWLLGKFFNGSVILGLIVLLYAMKRLGVVL